MEQKEQQEHAAAIDLITQACYVALYRLVSLGGINHNAIDTLFVE